MVHGKSSSRYLVNKANLFSGCRELGVLCLVLGLALLHFSEAKTQNDLKVEILRSGTSSSAILAGGEKKSYLLDAKAEQHVRLEIAKGDLALTVTVCNDEGQTCLEFTKRDYGTLDVSFTASTATHYRIQVTSLEKAAAKGRFELRVIEIVTAKERHRFVDAATRFAAEAESLKERHDFSSLLAAVAKYDEAQRMWALAGERGKAAESLSDSGDVYFYLSRYQEALRQYQQS